MSSGDEPEYPISGASKDELIDAYKGNLEIEGSLLESKVGYAGPYGIVDPRRIGYSYISYMFIESGQDLEAGFGVDINDFDEEDKEKSLMIGGVLGEYDFIHRRADISQYKHADFTVEAIDDPNKAFMKNAESYPIFSIGRWHGQDIEIKNMTQRRDVNNSNDALEPLEADVLYEMIHHPEKDAGVIEQRIRDRAHNQAAMISENELDEYLENQDLADLIHSLDTDYVIGKSVGINPANVSNLQHLLVGISVREGVKINDDDKYEMPNEKVIDKIRSKNDFDGWTMPYIVSGVGKSWGDIVAEIHTENIDDMEDYASKIRDVEGVRTTKTFAMTGTAFHKPLVLKSPDDIQNLT